MFWRIAAPLVILLLVVVGWYALISWRDIPAYLLPSPGEILEAFKDIRDPLIKATLVTARSSLYGFGLSLVFGCLIAFAMSQSKMVERGLYPYAIFLQTVPIIAIAPIIIIWLGPGLPSIVTVSFIISLFPIITSTATGLTRLPPEWQELFDVYQASWWQRLFKLRLPAAIPNIITGARTSAGLSVVGAIVGEYFTSVSGESYGIAYLVLTYSERLRTAELFATTIMSAILGLVIFGGVSVIGDFIMRRWHFNPAS